jgi:hypothetical protein
MSVNIFGSSGGDGKIEVDKKYVDQKFTTLSSNLATKVNRSGDTISGDLNILVHGDKSRTFGITDINTGQSVSLLLGNTDNQVRHNFGQPIKIAASYGTKFTCPAGDVCRLGVQTDARARFLKDIIMNNNFITGLHDPKEDQDAATKNYVDTRFIKSNVGYVPDLNSNNRNPSGFVVSASHEYGEDNKAYQVFNSWRAEWWAAVNTNFWIQILCPEQIRIHKFAVKGKSTGTDQIYNWKLQASNDDKIWDDLYVAKGKYIDDTISIFHINSTSGYYYYKILVINADGSKPGLSYWQLYTLDPIYTKN